VFPATVRAGRQALEAGHHRPSEARTFPIDPNGPGGPDRSEYLARHHPARTPVREHLPPLRLAQGGSGAMTASLRPTPFCHRLGLTAPVVQAPIGAAATPELAAAVSNAGGLGMLALSWTSAGAVRDRIRATRALTDRPFGVNLVLEWDQHERVRACANQRVAVVSTFWGNPRPYVDTIHAAGALHIHTVGSAEEACRAVEAGVDVIVAQGWEAGGRVRGEVATLALVPAVVDAVRPVPVLAAGGVGDGRGLAASLALGAEAAWVGTRFLLAHEANVHHEWRRRIQHATETDTVYTTLFDRGWPNAPHRTLRNSTVRAWEQAGRPAAPERPGEDDVVACSPDGGRLYRYGPESAARGARGNVEALALYAGQSAGIVTRLMPAAAIVDELISDAAKALGTLHIQR
jgi:NAD(P)H-dependent flavin oxidoreductase YrpB (nitropropane dioxygenase family)